MIRYTLIGLPKDKVIYEKADDTKENQYVFGDIVAQKDNIYFISKLPERKLLTIKNTNVITVPCEEFWCNQNLDKFKELQDNISYKYSYLNSNNIKIIYNGNKITIKDGQVDLNKSIYRQTDIKTNKDNYDFGISIKVHYPIRNEKIDAFSISLKYKFPSKMSNSDEKKLKQDMESMYSDYKNAVIQHFNIPTLNLQNSKYYYSNGTMEFNTDIDENGRYEETYKFSSISN